MGLHRGLVAFCLILFHCFLTESRILLSDENSLNFLQNIEGSDQMGQVIEGLNEIKHYLKKFGYYTPTTNVNNDQFDDPFVSALKRYQKQYHLNVTGTVDLDTLKQMLIPRCGNPDFNPSTNKTRYINYNEHGKLHIVSHYKFFDGFPRWSRYNLRYKFDESQVEVIDLQIIKSVIRRAFQKWASVTRFSFREADPREIPDITIGFFRGVHKDGRHNAFDGPGGVLAHATAPVVATTVFHYDAEENWSTNPVPGTNQMDLESVAVHELGHVLGLDHSNDKSAIMYPSMPAGVLKRDLSQDDINGITALYSN